MVLFRRVHRRLILFKILVNNFFLFCIFNFLKIILDINSSHTFYYGQRPWRCSANFESTAIVSHITELSAKTFLEVKF